MSSRPRDGSGKIIFKSFTRPSDARIHASDARLIGELKSTYISADNKDLLSTSENKFERLVISTPNADYLPEINLGHQVISVCVDGRWGAEDWGQWPQWYFDGREHFPYILRKPTPEDMKTHPLRRLWWNVTEYDFSQDPGLNAGLLHPHIAQELYDIRVNLMKEVDSCVCSNGLDWQKLQESARKMRSCTAALRFTPQPFFSVKLTVAAAQRYCLETRALLDKITDWDRKPAVSDEYPPANNKFLGCVTDRLPILYEMYEKGIPVWFVRPASQVPADINIVEQSFITRPTDFGIETKQWPGAPIFYQGPLSREIHAAIENWKPGSLDLRLLGEGSELELEKRDEPEQGHSGSKKSKRAEPYSKSQATDRVVSKRPHISVNVTLFQSIELPYSVAPLKVWKEALACVDTNTNRVLQHSNMSLFRGYAFPPPHIFCGEGEKFLDLMLGWLVVRTSWMGTIGGAKSRTAPLPCPQQWRTYLRGVALGLELTRPDSRKLPPTSSISSDDREVSHSTRRGAKLKDAAKEIFKIYVPSKKALQFLIWHDRIVWRRDQVDFPSLSRRLLVWDTQEHNFRLEFLTLDRCIMASIWATADGATARDRKFHAMWPDDVLLMASLPAEPSGIAAKDWKKRAPFVEAFQSIIMDWPGKIPEQLHHLSFRQRVDNGVTWDQSVMVTVETLAAKHYCQTFFDHFGRAPCIPCVLPTV